MTEIGESCFEGASIGWFTPPLASLTRLSANSFAGCRLIVPHSGAPTDSNNAAGGDSISDSAAGSSLDLEMCVALTQLPPGCFAGFRAAELRLPPTITEAGDGCLVMVTVDRLTISSLLLSALLRRASQK